MDSSVPYYQFTVKNPSPLQPTQPFYGSRITADQEKNKFVYEKASPHPDKLLYPYPGYRPRLATAISEICAEGYDALKASPKSYPLHMLYRQGILDRWNKVTAQNDNLDGPYIVQRLRIEFDRTGDSSRAYHNYEAVKRPLPFVIDPIPYDLRPCDDELRDEQRLTYKNLWVMEKSCGKPKNLAHVRKVSDFVHLALDMRKMTDANCNYLLRKNIPTITSYKNNQKEEFSLLKPNASPPHILLVAHSFTALANTAQIFSRSSNLQPYGCYPADEMMGVVDFLNANADGLFLKASEENLFYERYQFSGLAS
jgi:hypothetical protein